MAQNKEQQKKLLIEIMEADARDGLYKHQTSVEWLFEQVDNLDWKHLISEKKMEILEVAKQMEKMRITDAWEHGQYIGMSFPQRIIPIEFEQDAEQYYKITFGN